MDISENLVRLFKGLGGIGLLSWILGYSATFVNARLIERRLQRRELQYLHNSLTFTMFVIIVPLTISYALMDVFPKLVNDNNAGGFLLTLGLLTTFQVSNFLIVLYVTGSSPKKIKIITEFISKKTNWAIGISFIIALSSSLVWLIFIIILYQSSDIETRISVTPTLFMIYLLLFIPYYSGLMKKLNKDVLVNVYLQDGKILPNLLLSHRTFGKDIVFYDVDDNYRQNAVTVSKDHIQMLLSVEHMVDKDSDESKNKLKNLSSKIIKSDSSSVKFTHVKKKRKRSKKKK